MQEGLLHITQVSTKLCRKTYDLLQNTTFTLRIGRGNDKRAVNRTKKHGLHGGFYQQDNRHQEREIK